MMEKLKLAVEEPYFEIVYEWLRPYLYMPKFPYGVQVPNNNEFTVTENRLSWKYELIPAVM